MSKKYSNFFKIELFMLIFPLCSFSSAGPAATIDDYTTTQRYSLYDTHGKAPKGTSGKIALGKRGLIKNIVILMKLVFRLITNQFLLIRGC